MNQSWILDVSVTKESVLVIFYMLNMRLIYLPPVKRPSGIMHEAKPQLHGKPELQEYKFECSILAVGLDIHCRAHFMTGSSVLRFYSAIDAFIKWLWLRKMLI